MHRPVETLRRYRLLAFVTAALAAAVAACSGTALTKIHRDTLRIAITTSPATLNPLLQTSADEAFIAGMLFQPILAFDDAGNSHPVLAREVPTVANGGLSADGKTIVIHLRKGVRWSDGAPVTAQDAVFTAKAALNPRNNVVFREGFDDVASVRATGKWTVVYRLKRPDAAILAHIFVPAGGGMILPAHLLARYDSLNHSPFNNDPVGDGPFEVVRWVRGDRVVLKVNPYYEGGTHIASIEIDTIPSSDAAVLRLQSGAVDMLFNISSGSYRMLQTLVANGIRNTIIPASGWDALAVNVTHAPLGDPAVRAGIAAALDKPRLSRLATGGAEIAATEDIQPRSWAYNANVRPIGYNRTGAASALAFRHLALVLAYASTSSEARILAVQIQSELSAAGVRVSLKGYDPALLFAPFQTDGILARGKFDLAIDQYATPADPDNSVFVTCDDRPPAGLNVSRYCNRALDEYEREALAARNRGARKRAYAAVESILARDNPYVYICWQSIVVASKSAVAGFRTNGLQMFTTSANRWYMQ